MSLKIYVNKNRRSGSVGHISNPFILISDGIGCRDDKLSGCVIKAEQNNLGYCDNWNRNFFKLAEEDVSYDIDKRFFKNNRLTILTEKEGKRNCVIDFNTKEISFDVEDIDVDTDVSLILRNNNN
jgi:hypothetical protein